MILMDLLQKGRTIVEQYYSELLDRFNKKLKEKQPHLAKKKGLGQKLQLKRGCYHLDRSEFEEFD